MKNSDWPGENREKFTENIAHRRREWQLKGKFFLFITLKIHPEHIKKVFLWIFISFFSLRVPLILPIIICVLLEPGRVLCVFFVRFIDAVSQSQGSSSSSRREVLLATMLYGRVFSMSFLFISRRRGNYDFKNAPSFSLGRLFQGKFKLSSE